MQLVKHRYDPQYLQSQLTVLLFQATLIPNYSYSSNWGTGRNMVNFTTIFIKGYNQGKGGKVKIYSVLLFWARLSFCYL